MGGWVLYRLNNEHPKNDLVLISDIKTSYLVFVFLKVPDNETLYNYPD
jgi:hypothetical protein